MNFLNRADFHLGESGRQTGPVSRIVQSAKAALQNTSFTAESLAGSQHSQFSFLSFQIEAHLHATICRQADDDRHLLAPARPDLLARKYRRGIGRVF